jgi:hypothetical protein
VIVWMVSKVGKLLHCCKGSRCCAGGVLVVGYVICSAVEGK